MAERTFAGFRFQQRLSVGFYGEVFRGEGTDGEVYVLRVDSALAGVPKFAESLIHFGRALALLKHDHMVGTRMVGKARDGALMVVTESAEAESNLDELFADLKLRIRADADDFVDPTEAGPSLASGFAIRTLARSVSLKR